MAHPGEQFQVLHPVTDAPAPELANADLPVLPGAQQEVNILSLFIFVIARACVLFYSLTF